MGVQCTNCGHLIPSGQFRCGKCGHLAVRESMGDFEGLADLGELEASLDTAFARVSGESAEAAPVSVAEDDAAARESVVPKGTFASDAPLAGVTVDEAAVMNDARARGVREVDVAPRTAPVSGKVPTQSAQRDPADTSSRRIKTTRPPVRPPYLASEILREDLSPSEPGGIPLDIVVPTACAVGLVGSAVAGGQPLIGAMGGLWFLGLIAAWKACRDYTTRAVVLACVSASGLVAVSIVRAAFGGRVLDTLLTWCVALLPAGLFLRAWHRGSGVARVMVGFAVALCIAWATATSHRGLLSLGFEWQSWLPAVCWYLFVVLCLLAVLAFMGDDTTAGCEAWAVGLLGWYVLFAATRFALTNTSSGDGTPSALDALGLIEPGLAGCLSVASAQLAAHALGGKRRGSSPPPHVAIAERSASE